MNTITVVGNLAADPELRYTPKGQAIVEFSIADTPRHLNPATQKWEEGEANWFRVTAWDDYAKNIAASLKKGAQVIVIGRIGTSSYVDRNNENRTAQKIQAEHVGPALRFATATVERQRPAGDRGGYSAPASAPANSPVAPVADQEDIPF